MSANVEKGIVGGIEDESHNHTFLEDFNSNQNSAPVGDANAKQLELAFTIPNDTNGQSTAEFYKQAIQNLKTKYTKLEKLRLRGGYVFKPNEKSAESIKSEVSHLTDTLNTIDKVVNGQSLRLRVVFTAVFVAPAQESLNITDLLSNSLQVDEKVHEFGNDSWSVPYKIQHGRGVLKLSWAGEEGKKFDEMAQGRSRYYPVNALSRRMGPGPMLGSASYDPEKNVTRIWSQKSGNVELEGNHMDSEELEQYFPRNFHDE